MKTLLELSDLVRQNALRALVLFGLFLSALPVMATDASRVSQVDLATLVEERITEESKNLIPASATFDIRINNDPVGTPDYLSDFWRDERTGKFIANVVTRAGNIERIWGVATLMLEVPVPLRRLLPDEIVQDSDLHTVKMPVARVGAYALIDREQLVGMQVRRQLVANRPVQKQSVIPPVIIARGEPVKIEFNYGHMQLAAKGKSLSDAHLGQKIRVVNLSSNKTISAVARAKGIVVVEQ